MRVEDSKDFSNFMNQEVILTTSEIRIASSSALTELRFFWSFEMLFHFVHCSKLPGPTASLIISSAA